MGMFEDNMKSMRYNLIRSLTGNDSYIKDSMSEQGLETYQENILTYGILRKDGVSESNGQSSEGKVLLRQMKDITGPVAFTWSSVDFISDIEIQDDGYLFAESSPGGSEHGEEYGKDRIQIIKLIGSQKDVDAILESMDRLECGSGYKRVQIPMVKQDLDNKSLMKKDKVNMYLRENDKLDSDFESRLSMCKDDESFDKARNKMAVGGAAFYSNDQSKWNIIQKGDL